MEFSKTKFILMPIERQHKKCAELLRLIYDQILIGQETRQFIDHYHAMQEWMGIEGKLDRDPKQIADRYHQHLRLAKFHLKEHNLLPSIRRQDKSETDAVPWPIHIYLDHLRSAHNVGSILRTVEALKLGSIHFSNDTPFIDNKQVQSASMGTFEWVECRQGTPFGQLPNPIIVMETSPEAVPIHEFLFPESFTLVVGNEEYGCSDLALKAADYLVEIPLRGRKNSLNVANAFAICAAEILRQKLPLI